MKFRWKSLLSIALLLCLFFFQTRAAQPPSRQEVLDMVWHEQFDELERLDGELRGQKPGFYRGYSPLSKIYGHLAGIGRNTDDAVWKEYIGKLEQWARAYPESPTPRVALGNLYVSWAWKARGGGWGSEVTEEGWRLMRERLEKAREHLEDAERLPVKDPELYRAFLSVALGQGWPREEMEAVFKKGVELDPDYQQLYESKAYFLLPRWYGEPGEWEAFAQQTADARGGEEGDILYMAIARSQAATEGAEFFRNTRISYQRMKLGFEASLRRYPDYVWEMNSYCYFACIAGDRDTARQLFQKIGDRWEKEVWRQRNYFQQWQDWAVHRGRLPAAATGSGGRTGRVLLTPDRVKSALVIAGAIWLGLVAIIGAVVWLMVRRSRKPPPPLPRTPAQ